MQRGGKLVSGVAMLALAACGTMPGKLEIRPTPTRIAAGEKPVPLRIAEARAQFALGNVALALESFRKAAREDPTSVDALAGIASCYDRMGRFDLSRRHYEMALAYAPADTHLLTSLANSFARQGKAQEAASVRGEIAARTAAAKASKPVQPAPPPALAESEPNTPAPVAPLSVQAATPVIAVATQPVLQPQSVVLAEPQPVRSMPQPVELAEPVRVADTASLPPVQALAPAPEIRLAELKPLSEPVVGTSVTVDLPPPRPADPPVADSAEAVVAAAALPAEAPSPSPEKVSPVRELAVRQHEGPGPRIERLSMGVVAIVTGDGPNWRPQLVAKTERSTTVRFLPLREANARASRVRVLNAARVHRLAARTRAWLTARGWARMPIGDAESVLARSLIVYPRGEHELAKALSNQFGFRMEERPNAKFVTMLLGRDAARIEELQPKNA